MNHTLPRTRFVSPRLEVLESREVPAVADIAVTKSDGLEETTEAAGTTYTIRITNHGPQDVTNVTISDAAPARTVLTWSALAVNGASVVGPNSGFGDINTVVNLQTNGQVVITADLAISPGRTGTLINTATATLTAGDSDSNPANNSATDQTRIGTLRIPDGGRGSLYAVGTGPSAGHVKVYASVDGQLLASFLPYGPAYAGGVRVATGDLTGDGTDDVVVGTGPGSVPHVKVFDGQTFQEIASFLTFDPTFLGGLFVTTVQLNPAGPRQIVVGADAGATPHVKVFDLNGQLATGTPLASFFAFDAAFRGGVRVAAGDIDDLGGEEIVVGAGIGSSHVKAFDNLGRNVSSFLAFDPGYVGGVYVAVGNLNLASAAEIIVSADRNSSHVKVFNFVGSTTIASFLAFDIPITGGVRLTTADRNLDGAADLVVGAGFGALTHVKVFDGRELMRRNPVLVDSFYAFDSAPPIGIFVG